LVSNSPWRPGPLGAGCRGGDAGADPTLNAQRETLKGIDAGVALANSQSRPNLSATFGLNRDLTRSGVLDTGRSKGPILSGGLDVNLPLFLGGRVRNAVEAAKVRVDAGRAALKAVEGDVFTEAVGAYMDVIRDRAIVELNDNQVKVLEVNLQASTDLFRAGDLTRTDIAQSEARLSAAKGQLALAQARLTASEEAYLRSIGKRPDELMSPPPLPPLPTTASEAARIAVARNPSLTAALQQARAAGYDVRVAQSDRLPTLSGVLGGDYVNYINDDFGVGIPRSGVQTTVGVTTRIPLYQGGAPAARVRQARSEEGRLQEQSVATERAVVAAARSAFAYYEASKQAIRTSEVEVTANELAVRGAQAERRVGTRTVIEVLNAEQELLNSKVRLISARRDAYVAGFQLLQAMGSANSASLDLDSGTLYDPVANYRHVAGNWNDWAGDGRHPVSSTKTQELAEGFPDPAVQIRSVKVEPAISPKIPLPGATPPPVKLTEAAPTKPAAAPPAPRPIVETKPTPQSAPAPAKAAPAKVASVTPLKVARPAPPKPAATPPAGSGKWMIQLGAFRTPGAPQALYSKLKPKLAGKQPVYIPAGPLTRLLVGTFASRADAQQSCAAIGGAAPCYVVARD